MLTKKLQLLGDLVPETPYQGSAPGSSRRPRPLLYQLWRQIDDNVTSQNIGNLAYQRNELHGGGRDELTFHDNVVPQRLNVIYDCILRES